MICCVACLSEDVIDLGQLIDSNLASIYFTLLGDNASNLWITYFNIKIKFILYYLQCISYGDGLRFCLQCKNFLTEIATFRDRCKASKQDLLHHNSYLTNNQDTSVQDTKDVAWAFENIIRTPKCSIVPVVDSSVDSKAIENGKKQRNTLIEIKLKKLAALSFQISSKTKSFKV